MASNPIVDAVEARIGTPWVSADATSLPVKSLNLEGQGPADGSPFIELEYPLANEKQLTLGAPGANHWKEEGLFRVIVNETRGNGTQRVQGWIEELRTLYRGQYLSGVQCFEASGPIINNGNDLGNYWQMSFTVRYWYSRVG